MTNNSIKQTMSDVEDILTTQRAVKGEVASDLTLVTFYCAQVAAILGIYARHSEQTTPAKVGQELLAHVLDIVTKLAALPEQEAAEAVTTANQMLNRLISMK